MIADIMIGYPYASLNTFDFMGILDSLAMYDRSLTDNEIKCLWDQCDSICIKCS